MHHREERHLLEGRDGAGRSGKRRPHTGLISRAVKGLGAALHGEQSSTKGTPTGYTDCNRAPLCRGRRRGGAALDGN